MVIVSLDLPVVGNLKLFLYNGKEDDKVGVSAYVCKMDSSCFAGSFQKGVFYARPHKYDKTCIIFQY